MRALCRFWLLFLLVFAPTVAAQELETAAPEDVGLSSERLDRLTAVLQSYVDDGRVAGGVALLMRHGAVAYLQPFGWADREAGVPMQRDTIFRIASMTKPVTSVAVMILYEEGKLLLDDPVSKYIPAFKDMTVLIPDPNASASGAPYRLAPADRPITIRHLLTHTSGITYGFLGQKPIADMYKKAGISDGLAQTEGTIGEMAQKLARQPLVAQPGETFQYGLSTDVLGHLVEVVSGQTLDAFFRERIFEPVGMKDTHFFLPPQKRARLAAVYTPKPDGGIEKLGEGRIEMGPVVFSTSYPYSGPKTYFSGGAGLVSTAEDYARFLLMLLNGGFLYDAPLLSRKTVELMTVNQIGEMNLSRGVKFGLGFSVDLGPDQSGQIGSYGVYGWGGFFNTRFWVDPEEYFIGVIMTQRYPSGDVDILDKFRVMAYQAVVD